MLDGCAVPALPGTWQRRVAPGSIGFSKRYWKNSGSEGASWATGVKSPVRARIGRHCWIGIGGSPCADDHLEHGSQLRGRATDDVEHFARCRLLLQELVSSIVRARTSSNSRVLSIAMTAWFANVVRSSICFSVNGCTLVRRVAITPTTASSLSIGTARTVRIPTACRPIHVYSGSSSTSWMWTLGARALPDPSPIGGPQGSGSVLRPRCPREGRHKWPQAIELAILPQ